MDNGKLRTAIVSLGMLLCCLVAGGVLYQFVLIPKQQEEVREVKAYYGYCVETSYDSVFSNNVANRWAQILQVNSDKKPTTGSFVMLWDANVEQALNLTGPKPEGDKTIDHHPQLSPNGKKILFLRTEQNLTMLYAMDDTGKNLVRITPDSGVGDVLIAIWAPDSKSIFFVADNISSIFVYRVNIDGSELKQLHAVKNIRSMTFGWTRKLDTKLVTTSDDGKVFIEGLDGSDYREISRICH